MPTTRDRVNKVRGIFHNWVYRKSGGKIGGRFLKAPILLLTTTGRRTGRPRTVPLIYLADGERFVVVASNAGQDHDPAWFGNIQANPEAVVEVGGRSVPVLARVTDEAERAAFWPRVVELFSWYETYQRRTSRHIHVVVLEPR